MEAQEFGDMIHAYAQQMTEDALAARGQWVNFADERGASECDGVIKAAGEIQRITRTLLRFCEAKDKPNATN